MFSCSYGDREDKEEDNIHKRAEAVLPQLIVARQIEEPTIEGRLLPSPPASAPRSVRSATSAASSPVRRAPRSPSMSRGSDTPEV
jgi:hypothetical protein